VLLLLGEMEFHLARPVLAPNQRVVWRPFTLSAKVSHTSPDHFVVVLTLRSLYSHLMHTGVRSSHLTLRRRQV
jgi:hypothetical protein